MREDLEKAKISLTAKALALYFVVLPLDFVPIQSLGSVTKIVALLPLICFLFESHGRISFWKNTIAKWLIAFTILAVLSILYTINFDRTFSTLKTLLLNVLLVLLIADCKLYTVYEREYLQKALVVGSILAAIMLLAMVFSGYGGSGGYYGTGRYTVTVGDVAQDPNYFCGYLLFGFSYFFARGLKEKPLINFIVVFGFIGVALVTGSRGGFLALVICAIAVFILSGKEENKLKLILLSIIGLLVAILFIRFIIPMINADLLKRFTIEYIAENGTTNRFEIWGSMLKRFSEGDVLNQFFGFGYGTSTQLSNSGKTVAHNLYIDDLAYVGYVGLFLQIGFQVSGIKTALKNHSYLYVAILISMICLCMTLSLTSYKPLWSVMMMIMIEDNSKKWLGENIPIN